MQVGKDVANHHLLEDLQLKVVMPRQIISTTSVLCATKYCLMEKKSS